MSPAHLLLASHNLVLGNWPSENLVIFHLSWCVFKTTPYEAGATQTSRFGVLSSNSFSSAVFVTVKNSSFLCFGNSLSMNRSNIQLDKTDENF